MAKMTLKEFWESNKELYVRFETKEQAQKFFKESNALGKTWKNGFKFSDDWLDKHSYVDTFIRNTGEHVCLDILNNFMPQISLKYDFVKFEDIIMDLNDTIEMMRSDDYKERFKAEYYQLRIRYEKLQVMIDEWKKGELTFTPTCPKETYNFQLRAMKEYLDILVIRAKIENIDLE